jgi:diguanylate cyclase (GGDEF)-like protein
VTQFVGVQSSISQLLERHHGLAEAANHDTLTGLPNRRLLHDRLNQAITRSCRSNRNLAVCFLDLDGFKHVNDTQGHSAGDVVLRVVAARLSKELRGDDTVARLGGDEFVLIICDIELKEDVSKLLSRLLDDIAQPIMIEGKSAKVTASIGITLYPQDNCGPDELLQHADEAMYVAKHNGKAKYYFHQ